MKGYLPELMDSSPAEMVNRTLETGEGALNHLFYQPEEYSSFVPANRWNGREVGGNRSLAKR